MKLCADNFFNLLEFKTDHRRMIKKNGNVRSISISKTAREMVARKALYATEHACALQILADFNCGRGAREECHTI